MSTGKISLVAVLLLSSFILSDSAQANSPSVTFEWQGQFGTQSYPYPDCGCHSWCIQNWIDGSIHVRVNAKLEGGGGTSDIWTRFYSVQSVSVEIPFQYLVFPVGCQSPVPITENYLIVLNSSDFDLSYPPNYNGIPTVPPE